MSIIGMFRRAKHKEPMDFSGFFNDFKIDFYAAENSEKGICIWVANGYRNFKDYDRGNLGRVVPFVRGLEEHDRRALWEEFNQELNRRSRKLVEDEA